MDEAELNRLIEKKSWKAKTEAAYDRRSNFAGYIALLQKRGEVLSGRYRSCMQEFEKIFRVTSDMQLDMFGDLRSPDIILRDINDPNIGKRKLKVNLLVSRYGRGIERPFAHVISEFALTPTRGTSEAELRQERFSTTGNAFQGGTQFLADDYTWGRDSDQSYTWVERAWDELMPVIEVAEATQAMIWGAISNPELNPEFAERMIALQQA